MSVLSRLPSWTASDISDAAKREVFNKTISRHRKKVFLERSGILGSWIMLASGAACLTVSAVGWTILLMNPPKDTFRIINSETGAVEKPMTSDEVVENVPMATAHYYLRNYIDYCLSWLPERAHEYAYKCDLMSRPDQQARNAAWRNSPEGPGKAYGLGWQGKVGKYGYHYDGPSTRNGIVTHSFVVDFTWEMWHGPTLDSSRKWAARIDYQWRGDLPIKKTDKDLNPLGFQAIAFSWEPRG